MARQFIAGKNPDDVMKTLRKRRAQDIGFTVDLLGEAVVSEREADRIRRALLGIARTSRARDAAAGPIRSEKTPSFSQS